MEVSVFWDIIDTARESSGPGRPSDQALAGYLATRSLQDIQEYQQRFDEMHAALYRWDAWAVAYLIGGGCPSHSRGGPLFYEMVNYAAHDAFERITGGKDSFYGAWSRYRGSRGHRDPSPADMGGDFDFDDGQEMRRRLPQLSALDLRNVST